MASIFGPALLTLVMVASTGAYAFGHQHYYGGTRVGSLITLAFPALAAWHFALVVTKRRVAYLVYAIVNLFLYFLLFAGMVGP